MLDRDKYEHELDTEFRKSEYIKYFPFIGKKYMDITPKIMILGESYYIDPEIRKDGIHPNKRVKCYRNTSAVISGKDYHVSDYIWEYLSFYSFFQNHVGKGAKDKGYINSDIIDNSRKAYFDVINILKPDLIIVWGISKLFYEWTPQEDRQFVNEHFLLYKYKNLPKTSFWHIPDPSQGFSYEWYHDEFLMVVKELSLDISKLTEGAQIN